MTSQNARWELSQLFKMKAHIKSQGHDLGYDDENRIRNLRKFLDSQSEENNTLQSNELPVTTNKTADEIPF